MVLEFVYVNYLIDSPRVLGHPSMNQRAFHALACGWLT